MKILNAAAAALLAVSLLGACSSDTKVGDESSLKFDQDKAAQFGATTSTTKAGATETTAAPGATTTTAVATTLPPEKQQVTIDIAVNDQSPYFDPSLAQVQVGSKVRFTNKGTQEHSIVSDTGLFDSGPIAPGRSWIYTANQQGRFNYSDGGRPFAVGAIEVS
jgi:plastocyanin